MSRGGGPHESINLFPVPIARLITECVDTFDSSRFRSQREVGISMPAPKRPAGKRGGTLRDHGEQPQPRAAMQVLRAIPTGMRAVAKSPLKVPQNARPGE